MPTRRAKRVGKEAVRRSPAIVFNDDEIILNDNHCHALSLGFSFILFLSLPGNNPSIWDNLERLRRFLKLRLHWALNANSSPKPVTFLLVLWNPAGNHQNTYSSMRSLKIIFLRKGDFRKMKQKPVSHKIGTKTTRINLELNRQMHNNVLVVR